MVAVEEEEVLDCVNAMLSHKNGGHGDQVHVVREFKCDPCDKMFQRAYNLKSHELAKHQMRRFQCLHCDSNYSTAHRLSLHVQRAHDEKMVKCNMCDYKAVSN